jgi:hypothetical protein
VKESDYMLDPSLSLEQKDMLSALLDPLADDDSGIDLIGEELPAPELNFTGLTQVRGESAREMRLKFGVCVCLLGGWGETRDGTFWDDMSCFREYSGSIQGVLSSLTA